MKHNNASTFVVEYPKSSKLKYRLSFPVCFTHPREGAEGIWLKWLNKVIFVDFVLQYLAFADENSVHLVELYLDVDITKFTEENKVT